MTETPDTIPQGAPNPYRRWAGPLRGWQPDPEWTGTQDPGGTDAAENDALEEGGDDADQPA